MVVVETGDVKLEPYGTLFAGDRVFVAGHGMINGQILAPQRVTLNPSAVLTHHPFAGW